MDINQGYAIHKAVMLENGRGFALGEHPKAPAPFVTWACYDDEKGQRQYEWGHYGADLAAMENDFKDRIQDYQRLFHVKIVQVEAPGLYKYYSTQRPVDIGTLPCGTSSPADTSGQLVPKSPAAAGNSRPFSYGKEGRLRQRPISRSTRSAREEPSPNL